MKKKFTPAIFIFLFSFSVFSQNNLSETTGFAVETDIPKNNAELPCITPQQYEALEKRIAENLKLLNLENKQANNKTAMTTSLNWPLQASSNLTDCSFYTISAYVDQNTATGPVQDYNCGTNTYDGHRGTDISTWPFNFYKMDNNLVEVIAAAPGIIIDRHDGEFDRNCAANSLTANYIIVQHADGSEAHYWHMKNGSVTTKTIGQTVIAGEYLGVAGSSGSSSGPHLHFEVWNGSTVATRIDPYSGTCNLLNGTSWWANQKTYTETQIVRATAHTTDIVLPGCPTTETVNEGTVFQIPYQGAGLPAGYAKFYIFIRDEVSGLTATMSILNPNGTTFSTWTYSSTSSNKTKTWGWSKTLPTTTGTYTFQAVYNGITCSSTFDIVNPSGISSAENENGIQVYPNPSNGKFVFQVAGLSSLSGKNYFEIYNSIGQVIKSGCLGGEKTEIGLNEAAGMYQYRIILSGKKVLSGKFIIE